MTIFHVIKYNSNKEIILSELPHDVLTEWCDSVLEMLIQDVTDVTIIENFKSSYNILNKGDLEFMEHTFNRSIHYLNEIKNYKNKNTDILSIDQIPWYLVYLEHAIRENDPFNRFRYISVSYSYISTYFNNRLVSNLTEPNNLNDRYRKILIDILEKYEGPL